MLRPPPISTRTDTLLPYTPLVRSRIIVGDILPVDRARPQRHPAQRLHLLEAIRRDPLLIGRHHFPHRRPAALQPADDEAAPHLQLDGDEAALGVAQIGIPALSRNPGEVAGALVTPTTGNRSLV